MPYALHAGVYDPGIAQTDSLTHDDDSTLREVVAFYRDFDGRVDAEVEQLRDQDVELIVGDIAPIAFPVATRLGIPSIAIGNFTWDWIYEGYTHFRQHAPEVIDTIRSAYRQATLALRLPFSHEFTVFPHVRDLPLVARRASRSRSDTRRHFGLPQDSRVALLSFGGYGLSSLNLANLGDLQGWTLVVTDHSIKSDERAFSNVHWIGEEDLVSSGFRYEDLVAAADVVVTKPGYGIMAECHANGAAILYTSRGDFREYDLLVSEMPKYLRCAFISQEDLFAGRWQHALNALVASPPATGRLDLTGAETAAEIIGSFPQAGTG